MSSGWSKRVQLVAISACTGIVGALLLVRFVWPATATPHTLGVDLGPDHTREVDAGQNVVYEHVLTNTGTVTDTFVLDPLSSQGWSVTLWSETYPTETTLLPLRAGPDMTTAFFVSLTVPYDAGGVTDITVVTATSQASPTVLATAFDTTVVLDRAYLPLVSRSVVDVAAIATSPSLPGVIVVLPKTSDAWLPLRYSLNSGVDWSQVATIPDYEDASSVYVAIVPRADASVRIIVAVHGDGAGVYRTGDFGLAWAEQDLPVSPIYYYDALVASAAHPAYVFMAVSYTIWVLHPLDYGYALLSQDSGLSWSVIREGDLSWYTRIVPSPVLQDSVYLETFRAGWLRSHDLGETWEEPSLPIGHLELDAVDPDVLYGMGERSVDGGDTWRPWADQPAACSQLLAHPTASRVLLMRCERGLYCSVDAGDHWRQITSSPGDLLAPDHSVPGRILWARGGELWAGTGDCPAFSRLAVLP